jgi:peptidoglycan/LPS O-acetylase OafA/YrhL
MAQPLIDHAGSMSPASLAFIIATNIAIFGQDVVMFLGLAPGGDFFFTSNFRNTSPQLFNFLLVPQAWTLALELMFYLLAPFLVRRSAVTLVAIGLASLALRVVNYRILGFNDDPWTYRFFPTELMFFVAGILSYRLYIRVRSRDPGRMAALCWAVILAATASFQFLPGGSLKWAFYFGLVTLGLPFVFLLTRNNELDRQLGEMSYPVYISHIFVIGIVAEFVNRSASPNLFASISIAVTFLFSYVLLRYVGQPIEAVRQRRARLRRQSSVMSPTSTLVNTTV